jgi:hypothetical protein
MLFFACTPATLVLENPPEQTVKESVPVEVMGEDPLESLEPAPEPDPSRIFSLEQVHQVEITVGNAEFRSLQADPWTWVEGDIVFDGKEFLGVGLRLKGRYGSLRDLNGKAGWKVDLQQFGGEARLEGLQGFALGNMVQDMAFTHQVAAFGAYRAMGVPAPRVGYAWVIVNGEVFGLYILTEEQDDEFLTANYPDPSGNLYDGDYVLWEDWSYTLVDFYEETAELFELDEGEENGFKDIHRVVAALDDREPLEETVDVEQVARCWAVDAWIGHWDSYSYNMNNYRVYFNPEDGKAELLPWDTDQPFYDSLGITNPVGRLSAACKANRECYQRFVEVIHEIGPTIEAAGVVEETRKAIELIEPYAEEDPRKEQSMVTIRHYQQHLLDWLSNHQDMIDAMNL